MFGKAHDDLRHPGDAKYPAAAENYDAIFDRVPVLVYFMKSG